MSQHDLNLANQSFPAFRTDANAALVALGSTSKGPSRPSGVVAGQLWIDDDTPSATLWTLYLYDGSDDIALGWIDSSANKFYPVTVKGQIAGLTCSNNGSDALNDIDVAAGVARAESDDDTLILTSAITKRLDASWVVGTNQGGLDTGAEASSTLYAVWLIKRPDTGVVDVLFSTSFTAPTMPTNYTKKRLIGAVYNDASSNLLAFVQQGDYFRYTGATILDISDTSITNNTFEVGTLSVPPNALAHIYGRLSNATETALEGWLYIRRNGAADDTNNPFLNIQMNAAFDGMTAQGQVMVDASRQVQYAASEAAGTAAVSIRTIGFTMLTRSNP